MKPNGTKSYAKVQTKAFELTREIMTAQQFALSAHSEQFGLIERVRQLEEELARSKAWEVEKQRYELKAIGSSAFAYVVRADCKGSEPNHAICTQCYEKGIKSILQSNGSIDDHAHRFECSTCKAQVTASKRALGGVE